MLFILELLTYLFGDSHEDPFWRHHVSEYSYVLQSMYNQLRWFGNHPRSGLHHRAWNRCVSPTHKEVVAHINSMEIERKNLLQYVCEEYQLNWYPMRLLEFDQWCRQTGNSKGRNFDRNRSFHKYVKHILQTERINTTVLSVNVQVLSGDIYPVSFLKSQGFSGFERQLSMDYPSVFPINYVELINPTIPPFRETSNGDTVLVIVHSDDDHQKVNVSVLNDTYLKVIIDIQLYFSARLHKTIQDGDMVYSRDGGHVMYHTPSSSPFSLTFYLNRNTGDFLSSLDREDWFFESFVDILQYFSNTHRFKWTSKSIISLHQQCLVNHMFWSLSDLEVLPTIVC